MSMKAPDATYVRTMMGRLFQLSPDHAQGWGIATFGEKGIEIKRGIEQASLCPAAWNAVKDIKSCLVMGHIRNASVGKPSLENTHPFQEGIWCFGHNGTIKNHSELEAMLSPERRLALKGTTDSEMFFQLIMQCKEETGSIEAGTAKALGKIDEIYLKGTTALNFIMSEGQRFYCFRRSYEQHRKYAMVWADRVGDIIVASEPMDQALEWAEVPNGHMLIVGSQGKIEVLDLR